MPRASQPPDDTCSTCGGSGVVPSMTGGADYACPCPAGRRLAGLSDGADDAAADSSDTVGQTTGSSAGKGPGGCVVALAVVVLAVVLAAAHAAERLLR